MSIDRPGAGQEERLDVFLRQLRRNAHDHQGFGHVGVQFDRGLDLGRRTGSRPAADHFLLAPNVYVPSAFASPRSPVCSHPSTTTAAVFSGISK